jgi:hypothetical protein
MGFDVFSDYREFRKLVGEYAEHMLKHHPHIARDESLVRCYCSLDEFEAKFPTEQERTTILEHLRQNQESVDDATACCRPIFAAFPGAVWPQQPTVGD